MLTVLPQALLLCYCEPCTISTNLWQQDAVSQNNTIAAFVALASNFNYDCRASSATLVSLPMDSAAAW